MPSSATTSRPSADRTAGRRPRLLARIAVVLFAVVLLLVLAVWFGGQWYLARSVADYAGEKQVAELTAPVEITFDAMGVPQVWAETDADAFLALGWLHASERLFQMEMLRRMATGTLSEILGERAFQVDARQRRIGFHQLADRVLEEADPRTLALIDAYVSGANAWIEQARVPPPEFMLLRTRPRPWTPHDVAASFVYQTFYPTVLSDNAATHRTIREHLGDDVLDLLTVPREWMLPSAPADPLAVLLDTATFPLRMTTATNNWAVAPERSASGHALHAADPHLAIDGAPGFWYLVGLHSAEGLEVFGVTTAGVPVVAMGHNGQAAWSFSVAPLILVDHYTETFHPQDSLQVRTPDGYAPLEMRHEEIRVRGEDEARRVPVYRTPRGVLIDRDSATGTSMHWSGFDLMSGAALDAGLNISGVIDFAAFQDAVRGLKTFSVNWIYSDSEGTIAYQLGPSIPMRDHNPAVAQDAADPAGAHQGYHDFAMQPSARNPAQGWVATTNNPPAPPGWPVTIHGTYNSLRMERVAAWMNRHAILDRRVMEQMQLDFTSGRALRWRDLAAAGAARLGDDDLARRLRAWTGTMAPDDTLATVFAYWAHHMTRHLFEDELGASWQAAAGLRDIVLMENHPLIADRRTAETETAEDISARAMDDARAAAAGRPIGEVQTLRITHPLSQAPLVDRWLRLNRGPYPRGGDAQSLNVSAPRFNPETGGFDVSVAPSMRFVMDWADVDAFAILLPLGQSGNPLSPHYDDFMDLFQRDEWWTVPFSREAVEARTESRLRLTP